MAVGILRLPQCSRYVQVTNLITAASSQMPAAPRTFASSSNVNILVQEFIREAGASDIRALVVGEKVVAAMRRTGREGEFRSNLHQGGSAEPIKITPEERSTAVRSAKALGLNVRGVDLLRSNHGPVVMEVNSSPGLEGVEKATGIDIASKIIEFLEKNMRPNRTKTRGKG